MADVRGGDAGCFRMQGRACCPRAARRWYGGSGDHIPVKTAPEDIVRHYHWPMMDTNAASPHYDRPTITLHWLTAALVLALWLMGQTIDWFPKGTPRVFARSTHISLGVALAIVLVARLSWRLGGRSVHVPPAGLGWLDKLATAMHWLLYALLIATVAVGIANTWVRGDTIFNLFKIPAFDPGNKDLKKTVEGLHELAANTLLAVALFHAAAALLHHYFWKDDVLRRMLPARR